MWSLQTSRRHLPWNPSKAFPDHVSGRTTRRNHWTTSQPWSGGVPEGNAVWEGFLGRTRVQAKEVVRTVFIIWKDKDPCRLLIPLLRRFGIWWAGLGGERRNNSPHNFRDAVDPEDKHLPEFESQLHHLVFLDLHFLTFKMGRTE